jgi:predicted TIM-barrel fold metal-dependent hydrolase
MADTTFVVDADSHWCERSQVRDKILGENARKLYRL